MKSVTRRPLLLGSVIALACPTVASAQTADPAAPIRALDDALLQIMHAGAKTPFGERARILAPVIGVAFDLPQILKTSVGPRWSQFPMAQQIELMDVFTRYTVASYVANFDGFSGEKFVVAPQTRAVGGDQVVETTIVPGDGSEGTRIDYVMRLSGGKWKAVDVLLDGSISRVAVQRSDFRALVGGDAKALIASLRAKTAGLESGGKN
jgi:phospholipid transport system substrate-binding protein